MPCNDPCERTRLLGKMVVTSPAALRREPWLGHLEQCPGCRAELNALRRSLAVYRHFEVERLGAAKVEYAWESLAQVLGARTERHGLRRWIRLPVAAAVGTALLFTGLATWEMWEHREPPPAMIVKLLPEEQDQLELTLQHSLDPALQSNSTSADQAASMDAAEPPQRNEPLQMQGGRLQHFVPAQDQLIFSQFRSLAPGPARGMRALPAPTLPVANPAGAAGLSYPVYQP